jgi:hypothetical protein
MCFICNDISREYVHDIGMDAVVINLSLGVAVTYNVVLTYT